MKNTFLTHSIFSSSNNLRAKQEIADLEAAFIRADVNCDGKVRKMWTPQKPYRQVSVFRAVGKISIHFFYTWVDIEEYVKILKSHGIYTDRKQVESIFALADV